MKESRDADRIGSSAPTSAPAATAATIALHDPANATVRRKAIQPRGGPSTFELIVLEGPDAGKRVKVDPRSAACVLVGKSPLCGLRLDDPGVAARQCSLQIVDGRLQVIDLASNTTRVNGVLTREAFLSGGELLRIGASVLCVHRSEERSGIVRRAVFFGKVHGDSEAMRDLYPAFARVVHGGNALLVEGEAGVGKRLLAEELHRHAFAQGADRAPFVAFAERGAPASAIAEALFGSGGLVERARGGTLFVKEVLDLDAAGQQKLASVIASMPSEPEARRVRVILGSRGAGADQGRSLAAELEAHLTTTRIVLPPLRAREGDVLTLSRIFWAELGGMGSLPDDFSARFAGHTWPGNVRELRIAVQDRVRHGHESSGVEAGAVKTPIPPRNAVTDPLAEVIESDLPFVDARNAVLAAFEKRYVDRALVRSGKSVARAAAASGIAHRYFQVLRSRYRTA